MISENINSIYLNTNQLLTVNACISVLAKIVFDTKIDKNYYIGTDLEII